MCAASAFGMLASSASRTGLPPSLSRFIPPLRYSLHLRVPVPIRIQAGSGRANPFQLALAAPRTSSRLPALCRMELSGARGSLTAHLRAFDRPSWSLHALFAAPPRQLTDAEIEHLLALAQLHAPPAGMRALKQHMQSFLAFLETVKAADAGGCAPMHALPCAAVTASLHARDVAGDDAALEAVLCNASWQQESMFAVPKAIDG